MKSLARIRVRQMAAVLAGTLCISGGLFFHFSDRALPVAQATVLPRTENTYEALPQQSPAAKPSVIAVEEAPVSDTESRPGNVPSEACLANTLCELKQKVRWKKTAWTPSFCRLIAHSVLRASQRHNISPALLVAVMLNESDLDERAVAVHDLNKRGIAKDSGLMGIRCLVDAKGKCTNANIKNMPWTSVMDPRNNIELGARELSRWRKGGGIITVEKRRRDANGTVVIEKKTVPCTHQTHAYWAHYNHGPRYIDHGPARHYPHRVGVLYFALAKAMGIDDSELHDRRLTIHDSGTRPRTADRPIEIRYQKLCSMIRQTGNTCGPSLAAN